MNDCPRSAAQRLERPPDQLVTRLRQHLDRDVVWDQLLLDDLADEGEIGLRSGGEADLDLLEAEPQQEVPEAPLAVRAHRLDQRLVAVAEVDRAPGGRAVERLRRPVSVVQRDGRKRAVLLDGHAVHHGLRGS
jgi:hypothetical protein